MPELLPRRTLFSLPLIAAVALPAAAIAAAKKSDDYCRPASGVDMVDTSAIVDDAFLAKMAEVGVTTIGRYYDYEDETIPGKRLRAEELPRIAAHGMSLVVVFQHNNNQAQTFVDWKTRGPADAREALKLAERFSQPPNGAIYFGVDGDFMGRIPGLTYYSDEIIGYFTEINRVFDEANVSYPVGVYGSGETCATLWAENLAGFCWLSHSHGFSGSQAALADGAYDIEQYLHGTCGGRAVDFNKIRGGIEAYGQFSPQ